MVTMLHAHCWQVWMWPRNRPRSELAILATWKSSLGLEFETASIHQTLQLTCRYLSTILTSRKYFFWNTFDSLSSRLRSRSFSIFGSFVHSNMGSYHSFLYDGLLRNRNYSKVNFKVYLKGLWPAMLPFLPTYSTWGYELKHVNYII